MLRVESRKKRVPDANKAKQGFSCANEVAFKAAFMRYASKKRGGNSVPFTAEELTSCMKNQAPGSPEYSILSFEGSFHGRTFATLSATRSKEVHKLDMSERKAHKLTCTQCKAGVDKCH